MIHHTPHEGTDPHGMQLETFHTTAMIGDHEGDLIVKRNYGPEGVKLDAVLADPAAHLGAYTVMYLRVAGYDADNKDWFWAKSLPDGRTPPAGPSPAGSQRVWVRAALHASRAGATTSSSPPTI